MSNSLLFIPDISGYTNFIQNTEIEHSEHVIAEILEVLIAANTQGLELAEIEGDALFFYKENNILSQEKLLAQIETMYTAFHSHLKMLEKNRICTCNACATAPNLRLKIIVHAGEMQFLKVQGSKKPFGNAVITAHRLLKNSVNDNNYIILSKELTQSLGLSKEYQSNLYSFQEGSDEYDGKKVDYLFALIDHQKLKLKLFEDPFNVQFDKAPNLFFEQTIEASSDEILEYITNYRHRHLWVKGVDSFDFNENEVTRLGTEHVCNINGRQLNFVTVTKAAAPNEIVYGELTKSPPPVDELYSFYIIEPLGTVKSRVKVEVFWKAKSPLKKLIMALFVKGSLKKATLDSFQNLKALVEEGVKQD